MIKKRAVLVGIIFLSSILILYFGGQYLMGLATFSSQKSYYVKYKSTEGLRRSNPVILNGYVVGSVRDIQLTKDYQVLVTISLDEEIVLTTNTVAELQSSSILGGKTIALQVNNTKPAPFLKDNDTIQSTVERGLVDILDEGSLADDIGTSVGLIKEILVGMEGSGLLFVHALDKVDGLASDLSTFYDRNEQLFQNIIVGADSIIGNANMASGLFVSIMQLAREKVNSIQTEKMGSILLRVDSILKDVNTITAALRNRDGTLGRLLYEDGLYVSLDSTLNETKRLMNHLDRSPKDFFAPFGRDQERIQRRAERRAKSGKSKKSNNLATKNLTKDVPKLSAKPSTQPSAEPSIQSSEKP